MNSGVRNPQFNKWCENIKIQDYEPWNKKSTTQYMVKKHQNMRLYGVRNLDIWCKPIKYETLLSKKSTTQCLVLKHLEYKTMKYETTKSAVYPLVISLGKVHGPYVPLF